MRLRTHRWWLAAVAALFTPFIGVHITDYVPIGFLLLLAAAGSLGSEGPDAGFWLIAGGLFVLSYGLWLLVFGVIDRLRRSRAK